MSPLVIHKMGILRKKSRSPLGGHLNSNFGGRRRPRKRAIFGAVLIVLLPYIGSSLAASVTINGSHGSGSAIEFAQGIQSTIVCDDTIATSLNSSYSATGAQFNVTTITLIGVNTTDSQTATTSNQGCGNKALTLSIYTTVSSTTSIATIGSDSSTAVTFTVPTSYTGTSTQVVTVTGTTASTGITATGQLTSSGVATSGQFVLTLPAGITINASQVSKVALQTS
jgi:hypothetical protein